MELHSEKTVRFARTALKNHISALAVEKGIKESAARAKIAKSIGVDPSSVRQFCKREIVKPALKTMQKYVTWLANNPEPRDFDERDVERGNRMPTKDELRQKIKRLVDELDYAQSYIQELREKRDELLDRHQAAHPENSYWMENSEALIEISTGCMYEADNVRKRVCTIPIPLLMNNWRWDSDKETREENDARREKMLSESFGKVYQFARSITELYSNLGGWPDDEIIVDIKFQNIEGM
tara:strand:- start:218 stop:934 length:717 start_codon:yes stop_codon:yes gene_type:complete